jgi:hypothetical protein
VDRLAVGAERAGRALFGGDQCVGGRDDFREEGREVLGACVGVQDAGAQRLAAAEDGTKGRGGVEPTAPLPR